MQRVSFSYKCLLGDAEFGLVTSSLRDIESKHKNKFPWGDLIGQEKWRQTKHDFPSKTEKGGIFHNTFRQARKTVYLFWLLPYTLLDLSGLVSDPQSTFRESFQELSCDYVSLKVCARAVARGTNAS